MNGFMTGNYDSDYSSFWAGVNTSGSSSSSGSSTGSVSGSGNFPKYNLSEDQIKGVANIVQHEQGTVAGRYAEASQMANLTDIDGDDKATPENLIKKLKSGWYAKGTSRYEAGASGSAKIEDSALQAVKDVIVDGKRTLPRYINEHDYIGDIASADTYFRKKKIQRRK